MFTYPQIKPEAQRMIVAKEKLLAWLQQAEKGKDFVDFCGLEWRKNYGVFLNLPFFENSDPYYFEESGHLIPWTEQRSKTDYLSWLNIDPKAIIVFQPDITIFHKGTPKYFIDVLPKAREAVSGRNWLIKDFFEGFDITYLGVACNQIAAHHTAPYYLNFMPI